jgi:glycogen synthase
LGDVAGSLPHALRNVGSFSSLAPSELDVRLVIPFHQAIRMANHPLRQIARYKVHSISGNMEVDAYVLELDGLPVYLINGAPIEQAASVYSSNLEADGYKYVFFSQAALQLPKILAWKLDILHANDGLPAAAYSLALSRPRSIFPKNVIILTIHNLPYLGAIASSALSAFSYGRKYQPARLGETIWRCL